MTEKPTIRSSSDDTRRVGRSARQVEQLALVTVAIILALVGFAVHPLWFAAVVVLAILWGYQASMLRGTRRGGGMVSAIVTSSVDEARELAGDAATSGSAAVTSSSDEQTKKELYEKAREADIAGRSSMTKDELHEALGE